MAAAARKRPRRADADEAKLAASVFGDSSLEAQLGNEAAAPVAAEEAGAWAEEDLFTIDTAGAAEVDGAHGTEEEAAAAPAGGAAAWTDEQEARLQVNIAAAPRARKLRRTEEEAVVTGEEYAARLKAQFESTAGDTAWAAVASGERESEALQAALRSTAPALAKSARLGKTHISVTRCVDANITDPARSVVRSVAWHPDAARSLLMVGSNDKRLRFFAIDGERNGKVASAFTTDMPVTAAGFAQGGAEVIAVGRRPFFYCYDVESGATSRVERLLGRTERSWESMAVAGPAASAAFSPAHAFFGRQGSIALVAASTKQVVGSLKMNGQVRAGSFSPDGTLLVTVGTDGEVYHWDMRTRKCLARHEDEGLSAGTAVAMHRPTGVFAVGAASGVVNLYDAPTAWSGGSGGGGGGGAFAPLGASGSTASAAAGTKPRKAVMNLTTAIDALAFNHDGQLMALASHRLQDQLRLLHVPSGTVYQNWPTSGTPLHYVESVAFSPDSSYLAMGNDKGRVLLYALNHYTAL